MTAIIRVVVYNMGVLKHFAPETYFGLEVLKNFELYEAFMYNFYTK